MPGINTNKPFKWPILVGCVLVLVVSLLAMPQLNNADAIGYGLRVTARTAFAFLMLAYLAAPLTKLFGVARTLLVHRRHLGLAMAFSHTVHFGYVVALLVLTDTPLEPVVIVGGGLAFLLMWAMAATSNDWSRRALGKRWAVLHGVGLHYLWLIFMQSFLPLALQEPGVGLYTLLTLWGALGLILRIWVFVRNKLANPTAHDTTQ